MTRFALGDLDSRIVGRSESYFADDLRAAEDKLTERLSGRRVLIIGGAGSIGFQTLRHLASYQPRAIYLVDRDENGLAEAVRFLRTGIDPFTVDEFITLPFDYGSRSFRLWLAAQTERFDYVLNFAALKHVRSEKDPYSILAMLEVNVLNLLDLQNGLCRVGVPDRLFCVSTDKAANPSSMMGATKRLMEHALFLDSSVNAEGCITTSARFANVALSNGSLLQSWSIRLAHGQPMACPEECRRFFVTLPESGHLCTLAALLGRDQDICVPTLDPASHLVLLQDVAASFLAAHGYEPHFTHDEDEARRTVDELRQAGRWPVLLTPLNTAGEKPFEEFVAKGEDVTATSMSSLNAVSYIAPPDEKAFHRLCEALRAILSGDREGPVSTEMIKSLIAEVEPSFLESHRSSQFSLDQRM